MAEVSVSASAGPHAGHDRTAFWEWFAARRREHTCDVTRIAFDDLVGWRAAPGTGNLVHDSGRFFTVEGLDVRSDYGAVAHWSQPIIVQPEYGILGMLVRRSRGVVECLVQAKMEPGNVNGVQLSPTVQATRSNYTRVHHGRRTAYLEHFTGAAPGRVLIDVLHSEQGSWFYRKRNRNMIVEVDGAVAAGPGFRWVPLPDLRRLLAMPNMVNMDTRSVLSCLPVATPQPTQPRPPDQPDGDAFRAALARSFAPGAPSLHRDEDLLNWFTAVKAGHRLETRRIPLAAVDRWVRSPGDITHEQHRYFSVVAVAVTATGREVTQWTQPLIRPLGEGIVAFLARPVGGVLHVLVHARVEPGYIDVVELSPTVQCTPANYRDAPPGARPAFLDDVLRCSRDRVRYDTVQSEEGGRFYHAQNRYQIIDATDLPTDGVPPAYRWVTVAQLAALTRHTGYLNVQARSLLACLDALR